MKVIATCPMPKRSRVRRLDRNCAHTIALAKKKTKKTGASGQNLRQMWQQQQQVGKKKRSQAASDAVLPATSDAAAEKAVPVRKQSMTSSIVLQEEDDLQSMLQELDATTNELASRASAAPVITARKRPKSVLDDALYGGANRTATV